MTHLADGALRRLHDHPRDLADADRRHLDTCARCRARRDEIVADATAVASLLALPDFEPDVAHALSAVTAARSAPRVRPPFLAPAFARAAALVAVALVAIVAFTATGLAESFLTIFEPKQFVGVRVDTGELRALPDLSAYGTTIWDPQPSRPRELTDLQAAVAELGFTPLGATQLPPGVTGAARYLVYPRTTGTFTFDARKAAQRGATPPPNIARTTLRGTVGPMVAQVWGTPDRTKSVDLPFGALPLAIVQARMPLVQSDGVSVRELQDYLLAQPGVSPDLAAQIRAIGDPATTLPVPLLANQRSHPVDVQGTHGLFVGDNSGGIVIWQKDGYVFAVAGLVTESQALAVANSLR